MSIRDSEREATLQWTSGDMNGITHIGRIASGGYGEVHKMLDQATQKFFARKILRVFGDVHREDIEKEANTVSQLCTAGRCKNVVEVIRHGWLSTDSSYYYIDMEYCFETLNDRIQNYRIHDEKDTVMESEAMRLKVRKINASIVTHEVVRVTESESEFSDPKLIHKAAEEMNTLMDFNPQSTAPVEDAETTDQFDLSKSELHDSLDIIDDIVNALIYIHGSGTVHRDLKPKNVLFSQADNCWKIADFGTASQATSSRQYTTHLSRGTGGYRAPEILNNKPKYNKRTDIFALGCIIYEIITLEQLFCDDFAIIHYSGNRILNTGCWPESDRDISPQLASLEQLVASMLEIDHNRRPSADKIREELKRIREGVCSNVFQTGPPIQRYLKSEPLTFENEAPQRRRANNRRQRGAKGPGPIKVAKKKIAEKVEMPMHDTLEKGQHILLQEHRDMLERLHEAARKGHVEVVRSLLDAGADVAAKDGLGQTALHWAAMNGHAAVVALLLGHMDKAPDLVAARDEYGRTALHRAAIEGHKDVVALLLSKMDEADVAAKDRWQNTALHRAAASGHKDAVALLLSHMDRVDVAAKDRWQSTALHRAAMGRSQGHKDVVALLQEWENRE